MFLCKRNGLLRNAPVLHIGRHTPVAASTLVMLFQRALLAGFMTLNQLCLFLIYSSDLHIICRVY